ncbi:EAL domain-containing protein [Sphingomonas nostoxanthinifaciens]|uniref:EAL domain-containing protein n=1 Tax=Sphingomonas nostoxanthinifaciens TaxID=2872652 RepID=UPI001CC1E94C|nr:EAL domain-containing protein [Sphingomonas nostoxanthinifaciens]UAK24472.1 EAL domain-containing protein [Sphingomonas nostoxanthinifaciens]
MVTLIQASGPLWFVLTALSAALVGVWFGARLAGPWRPGVEAWRRRARQRLATLPGGRAPTGAAALADGLETAIVRNELFIVHQPKMRARTGEIGEVETLVRWQHPTHGLIGPNDFIGLAEERGEIRRITEWVIRQAIVEQHGLAQCGHTLAFNINISARLLADRDFADWALATVREASGAIGFEITETALIADPEGALRNIHLFADAGIRIAIDDYGAGLSSLAYLKQLPANELKIDRMFVSGLSSSHRDPLLVRSTIDLAHALEMEVTAEGVDSPAALALLKVMGCDIIQGFLIAQPMRLGELRAFLDTRDSGKTEGMSLGFNWLRRATGR